MDIGLTLTAFGGMMAGFYAIARVMLTQASRDREADRKERVKLSSAITQMAKSSERVAEATQKQADQSEQRNGHLAELVLQGNKLVQKDVEINTGIRSSLEKSAIIAAEDRESLTHPVQNQNIEKQVVAKQVIKDKE